MDEEAELLALEQTRCQAIAHGDRATLIGILSPDYVHVHATGKIDDREGHIAAVERQPRRPERGPLAVRRYGDVAVLVGEQINHAGEQTMVAVATQVAVKTAQGWRFVSMQVTRKP